MTRRLKTVEELIDEIKITLPHIHHFSHMIPNGWTLEEVVRVARDGCAIIDAPIWVDAQTPINIYKEED